MRKYRRPRPSALTRQPMLIVADELLSGSVVLYWETSAAPADPQQLVAQAWATGAAHAREAFAQGLNYRCGQGFTSDLGDLTRQPIRLGVFNT